MATSKLTFICYPKCSTCQKAKALLDNFSAEYEVRDIKADNPTYEELKSWIALSGLPVRKFFNTSGALYKSLNLKEKLAAMSEEDCIKLLATDGMLVKRPLLVDEYRTLVGFKPYEWESVFTEYDRKKLDDVFQNYFDEMLQKVKAREESEGCGMVQEVIKSANGNIAIIDSAIRLIFFGQSALDLGFFMEQDHNCRKMVLNKSAVIEDFFNLSTGIAGEVAQKLVKSDYRLAIVGDFSEYDSKPLHDFILESNKGKHLYFAADKNEAVKMLEGGA